MTEGNGNETNLYTAVEDPAGPPPMPGAAVPRDRDGIVAAGTTLVIGSGPGVLSDYFVAPIGKSKRSQTFPRTAVGRARAWQEFETAEPAAAANYRSQETARRRAVEAAAVQRVQYTHRRALGCP